jgi:hypothetical protein
VNFLRRWLSVERPPGIALHSSQSVELDCAFDEVFERCTHGIVDVLGGTIDQASAARATIEASFGLIHSERLTCTLRREGDKKTRVFIEARRGASTGPTQPSQYVRALADYLMMSRPT